MIEDINFVLIGWRLFGVVVFCIGASSFLALRSAGPMQDPENVQASYFISSIFMLVGLWVMGLW